MRSIHFFSFMRPKPWLAAAGLLCGLAFLPATTWAATKSKSKAPEKPLVSWEWLEKNKKLPPQQIMDYYRAHPEEFAVIPFKTSGYTVRQAFFLAATAYKLKAAEFNELHKRADEAADEAVHGSDWMVALQGAHAQQDLMQAAVQEGAFDLAMELAENGRRRTTAMTTSTKLKKDDAAAMNKIYDTSQNLNLRMIARSLGDFSELERLIHEEMEENEKHSKKTLEKLRKIGSDAGTMSMLQGLLKMQAGMHLPELAEALARQGKIEEAKKLLSQYQEGKKEEKGEAVAMFNGFVGGARAAKDGITFAEIWLAAGEPANALKALAPVEKGITHFTKIATKGSAADYVVTAMGKYNATKARCLWMMGSSDEAMRCLDASVQAMEKLPRTHPDVIRARQEQLWGWLATGQQAKAQAAISALAEDQMTMVGNLLKFAGERQRMTYLQQADPFSLLVATGETERLVEAVLRLKGVVLDSVLEERGLARQAGNEEARAALAALSAAQQKLSDATRAGAAEVPAVRAEVESLEFKLATLAKGKLGARTALGVTVAHVQEALATGDALVEFITYRHLTRPGQWEARYGAVVLRPGMKPVWQPLEAVRTVDAAIAAQLAQQGGTTEKPSDAETADALHKLYQLLIAPLETHLQGTNRLILSPDGGLGRLSFAPLLAPDQQFVAEKWQIGYVSTGRDLLKTSAPPASNADMLIYAIPDFNAAESTQEKARSAKASFLAFDREALPQFEPLPGTLKEMQALQQLASRQGMQVKTLHGAEAREAALDTFSPSPTYLHFATHGTVLQATNVVQSAAQRDGTGGLEPPGKIPGVPLPDQPLADNPLQRSVLALAGANATFAKWRSGMLPPAATDGVLSAEELAGKNLESTWLCVLSACETAAGAPLSGEGVLGMRRGFFLAGVDHLVMTFWSIADDTTADLMADFYAELGRGSHPAAALHRVQRNALVKWRAEKGLADAVFLAGPFALSTTGGLPPP